MASVTLSESHQMLLTALVNLSREQETPITGAAVADEADRAPGAVHNQMSLLKSLGLVSALAGPNGGYEPTPEAHEVLGFERVDQPASVPIRRDDEALEGLNVEGVKLTNVDHPARCRATIRVTGSLNDVHHGDEVEIGPAPFSGFTMYGRVESADTTNGTIVLNTRCLSAEGRTG